MCWPVSRFLTNEWIAELHRAAQSSPRLAQAAADADLTVQHMVTDGPLGEFCYHVVLRQGVVAVRSGSVSEADVTFTLDYSTAAAIASGSESAQGAFVEGNLRLGGRVDTLLRHRSPLADLDDVFADVRAGTEFPDPVDHPI